MGTPTHKTEKRVMVAIIFGNDMREEHRIPWKKKEADPYGQPPFSYCRIPA